MDVITSKSNKKYSRYKSLKQKKFRDREGLFLIEGEKLVDEALESDFDIQDIIVSQSSSYIEKYPQAIVFGDDIFKDLTEMKNPEGVIGVLKKRSSQEVFSDRIICLDGIQDPGNLGTIIRTAEAFGFEDIVLMPGSVDPYNSKVLRGSMGSIFRVKLTELSQKDILELKNGGYKLISSSLDQAEDLQKVQPGEKYILVIGSESHGISDFFKSQSDLFVKIPIKSSLDSLNAAIAAGIMMYDLSSRS